MNTGTEKLALGRGPQTFVSPRTSGAPLALRLNTFARPASAPVAVLRSRSVADLDLRALQAFVETPPEVTDAESAAIFDEPRAPPISRLDQPPRMTTRAAPDVPPVSRATELSAPVTQAWPAAVADEVPRLTVESPIYPSTEALALPETRARPSAAAPPMFVAPHSPLPARVDDPVKTASTPVTPPGLRRGKSRFQSHTLHRSKRPRRACANCRCRRVPTPPETSRLRRLAKRASLRTTSWSASTSNANPPRHSCRLPPNPWERHNRPGVTTARNSRRNLHPPPPCSRSSGTCSAPANRKPCALAPCRWWCVRMRRRHLRPPRPWRRPRAHPPRRPAAHSGMSGCHAGATSSSP